MSSPIDSIGFDGPAGMASDLDVVRFAFARMEAGERVAMATIVGLEGPFSRPLGAQLAICEDGRFAGSISGGCLETALVEEARGCLASNQAKTLRYGVGSPYVDVRLPCGGAVDLRLDVNVPIEVLRGILDATAQRDVVQIEIPGNDDLAATWRLEPAPAPKEHGCFVRSYNPCPRLMLAGRGWEIVALAEMASGAGFEVHVASQEKATLNYCRPYAAELVALTVPAAAPELALDSNTALACLFHEHEWEVSILKAALESAAWFVGALGSRQTHATRVEMLQLAGVEDDSIARIHGPIGMFHATDPKGLAISTLAQIRSLMPQPDLLRFGDVASDVGR